MKYLLTGKQMQAADRFTIENIGIPSMVLMERAALQMVHALKQEELDMSNILVVCGTGNNGGDGYAIARLLHLKGYAVSIMFIGDDAKRSIDNCAQKKITDYYNIPVKQELENEEYSIIIDAIFGNGLSRNIEGNYFNVIQKLNQMGGYKVAVDIPSGINDETGHIMGIAFQADLTLAVAYAKRGQVMEPAKPYIGKLNVLDIGIYKDAISDDDNITYCYDFDDFQAIFPKRNENSHKGSYGKVLLIVGSSGMSGAAYLCAKAAYAVGAGLVQIYTHEDNRIILQEMLPEAIISTYCDYNETQLIDLLQWATVVGIGCGLGTNETSERIVQKTLQSAICPCVVDADALNLIAKDITQLKGKRTECILTPHMKEMSRLLQCEVKDLQSDKWKLLQTFTNTYEVTCVLKDARTLVSKTGENTFLNLTGNSAMAKAGSGDVLTGIITGILAQNKKPYEAACLGVYLHGMCGDFAREQHGPYGVLASNLIESINPILKKI